MKSLFLISLLFVMLVQPFSKLLIVADYQANKAYIMEFLCINRDKPELQCEGHCYLQKKLDKQDQTEKQQDKQKQAQEFSINLFCYGLFKLKTPVLSSEDTLIPAYHAGPTQQVSLLIFHPPKFLV